MTPARRHAESTRVPIAQTRSEIERLLRDWECDGVRWTDHFKEGRTELEFVWTPDGAEYSFLARFELAMDLELRDEKREQEWRRIHRVLRVYLMGQFNAVEAGLLSLEQVLLPHLVVANHRTVADHLLPELPRLMGLDPATILPETCR